MATQPIAGRVRIDDVLRAVSLRAVVVQTHQIGRNGKVVCVAHNDHDPSCSIKGERWECFACGAGGSVLDWVMHRDGVDLPEAVRRLAETANVTSQPIHTVKKRQKRP